MQVPTNQEAKAFVKAEMKHKKLSHAAVRDEITRQGRKFTGLSVWLLEAESGIMLHNLHAILSAIRAL